MSTLLFKNILGGTDVISDGTTTLKINADKTLATANPSTTMSGNNLATVGQIPSLVVTSISGLLTADTSKVVNVINYHTGLEGGGGVFYWDASKPKAEHNGGTVIDPTVTFPSDWNNQTQLSDWFTADSSGSGCWVRQYDGAVNVKWFGAKGDGVSDDTKSIQISINSLSVTRGGEVEFHVGAYLISSAITISNNNILLTGIKESNIDPYSGINYYTTRQCTVLALDSGSLCDMIDVTGQAFKIKNMVLVGNGIGANWTGSYNGIYLNGTAGCVENVIVSSVNGHGVQITNNAYGCILRNVNTLLCNIYAKEAVDLDMFQVGSGNNTNTAGIVISGGASLTVTDVNSWNNKYGIEVTDSASGVWFTRGLLNQNINGAIYLNTSASGGIPTNVNFTAISTQSNNSFAGIGVDAAEIYINSNGSDPTAANVSFVSCQFGAVGTNQTTTYPYLVSINNTHDPRMVTFTGCNIAPITEVYGTMTNLPQWTSFSNCTFTDSRSIVSNSWMQGLSGVGGMVEVNGVIIQWGQVIPTGTGAYGITFPQPFPNNVFSIFASAVYNGSTTPGTVGAYINSRNDAAISLSNGNGSLPVNWMAIGN